AITVAVPYILIVVGFGYVRQAAAKRAGRRERRATKYLGLAEGRLRVLAPRAGHETRIGAKGARRPLPNVAEAKTACCPLMRRGFPLGLARQAPAGPAAPRIGLVPADVRDRFGLRHARQSAEAVLQHAMPPLIDVARRPPRMALDPGPAVLVPMRTIVVAAILDKLAVLRPRDRLGVDLELGDRDRMRLALLVEAKAGGTGARQPAP